MERKEGRYLITCAVEPDPNTTVLLLKAYTL
jgi:hypothetical protein